MKKIRKTVTVEGKHKKQSGGHGQYGHVKMEFAPYPKAITCLRKRSSAAPVPKNFHPAVDKGIREAMEHGVLAGYPLVGLHATLLDGSYHDVDSTSFRSRWRRAWPIRRVSHRRVRCCFEPVCSLRVVVPDSYMGDGSAT